MAVVVFNPVEFKQVYPQYADFADEQLQYYFDLCTILVNNTERSKIPYNPPENNTRKLILYALVCHLCELSLRGGGIVGSLSNATEGSVSAGFTALASNPSGAWYNQTQCGALAYQLLSAFSLGGRAYNGCFC